MTGSAYLHKASFVVPVSGNDNLPSVLNDGAILTRNGRIVEVGFYEELRGIDALEVDHGEAVLMPALVNCHSHLELSHLAYLGRRGGNRSGDMTGWISELLAEREKTHHPEDMQMAAWQALARLYAGGCRGVLDVGNLPESREIAGDFKTDCRFFRELLGLSETGIEAGLALLASVEDESELFFAAHAPYSTAPQLLAKLKERAGRYGHLLPVHVAESAAESEFLASGAGAFRRFLEERKVWDNTFKAPGLTPVAYLDRLNILDERTLCVHCVHCDEDDLEIIARRRSSICLCPGSNRYLGVGVAPAPQMLDRGIRVVLGTDSMASNPHLSLWQEMRVLSEDHPDLEAIEIIRMASRNGAELMGLAGEIGSLDPGCSAAFLAIRGDNMPDGDDDLLKWLVTAGLGIITEWVE